MKLLLDEMFSADIADKLNARGHDAKAISGDPQLEGLPEAEVMKLARAERRAIVTNNVRDYRPLHVAAVTPGGPGHHGMVFMAGNYRRTRGDIGRIVKSLERKLAAFPGDADLADAETWLS